MRKQYFAPLELYYYVWCFAINISPIRGCFSKNQSVTSCLKITFYEPLKYKQVGWVEERNPTPTVRGIHKMLGFASLNPTYPASCIYTNIYTNIQHH